MNILGYNYTVKRGATTDELGALGKMIAASLTILVASDLVPQQAESTILHEIIEVANYMLNLGLEHKQISGMEVAVYGTLIAAGVDLSPLAKSVRDAENGG